MSQREHPIAGVDSLRLTPDLPHGGAVTTGWAVIFNVIVKQGKVVDQFYGRRSGQSLLGLSSDCLTGQQAEERPTA